MTATATRQTARQRLTAIRNALALADDLLATAYAERDWSALGHASWEAYCAAELPELRMVKLRKPERQARVAALSGAGASVREIAAATGASVGTVHNDLDPQCHHRRSAQPAAAPVSNTARVLAALDTRPGTVFDLMRRTRLRQAQLSPLLSRLTAAGRIVYTPPARRGGTGTYATVTA